ncbi:MAG: HD domain-containing protein [Candidatus Bipolaricaulota bacterium]|nr:HD domain-containing protein [Candidatus Bipolaricaulota bacterium]
MEIRDDLLTILPEIGLIGDEGLREKVLSTWEAALDRGGWKPTDIERMPFTLAKKVDINFAQHIRSVTKICLAVANTFAAVYQGKLNLDQDTLLAGALLHDVGKLLEMEEKDGVFEKSAAGKLVRHPFSGVALADAHGIPAAVQHIIGTHSKEGDPYPRTPEAVVLHLADFMNFDTIEG